MLSQGVPMLSGGDEIGRTQHGNNNAWCQDNELSWFDWDLEPPVASPAARARGHPPPSASGRGPRRGGAGGPPPPDPRARGREGGPARRHGGHGAPTRPKGPRPRPRRDTRRRGHPTPGSRGGRPARAGEPKPTTTEPRGGREAGPSIGAEGPRRATSRAKRRLARAGSSSSPRPSPTSRRAPFTSCPRGELVSASHSVTLPEASGRVG